MPKCKAKNVSKALGIILFLILAATPAAWAAPGFSLDALLGENEDGFHQYLPTEKLAIFGQVEEDVFNLAQLTRLCSREVDALFGDQRPPEHRLNFYAMDISFAESDFKTWDVPLRTAAPLEVSVVRVLRGLLRRQLRERLGVRKKSEPPSLQFLAAALANRIVYDGKGTTGHYRKDYRIPRRQLASGICPDLRRLLAEPPPEQSRLLYRIYLVHCDLLLSCLERERSRSRLPQFLLEWWRLECRENLGTAEALARLLSLENAKLQEWYAGKIAAILRGGDPGEAAEDIAGQLRNLLAISVVELGGDTTVRTVPLEEIPKLLKNRPLDLVALTDVQNDLLHLKIAAPPIFQESLDQFIAAVNALRNHDVKLFQKRYHFAQKQFEKAEKLQRKVHALLDEAEAPLAPVDTLQAAAWNAILQHRSELRSQMDLAIGLQINN